MLAPHTRRSPFNQCRVAHRCRLPIIGQRQRRPWEEKRDVGQGLQRAGRVGEPGLHRQRASTWRCTSARSRTRNGFWGEMGKRIDWIKPYTKVKNTSYAPDNVSIKWYEDGTLNVSANCIDRHLKKRGDQVAIIWEGDDPTARREDHLPPAARAGLQVRQRAEGQRRQEGRPRHHLPADDPRGGLRHAGLRPHRRRALGGVRRLLARQPRRAASSTATPSSSSPPTRACAAAGRSRSRRTPTRRSKKCKGDEKVLVVRRTGTSDRLDRRPRHLAARGAGQGRRRLPARGDERGGPAVHPLHLGLDRQAQGRAAHLRRLSRLSPRSRTSTCSTTTTATSTGARPTSAG